LALVPEASLLRLLTRERLALRIALRQILAMSVVSCSVRLVLPV
jgi:hypothetical protein